MSDGGNSMQRDIGTQEALDLLTITRDFYPNRGQLDVLTERHKFPVMNQWFAKDRIQYQSGPMIQHNVILDENGTAQFVKPYEPRTQNVRQVTARMLMPWRLCTSHYNIEDTEVMRNRSADGIQLMNLLDTRRAAAELSMANLLETYAWRAPPSGGSAERFPHGIPYWLVPITSAQVSAGTGGSHQGSNPSGFSDTGGIDASDDTYELWRSYNDVWSNGDTEIQEVDVDKMLRMQRRLRFEVPMNATDWLEGRFDNFRGYIGEDRLEAMDRKARENNDSLGANLGMFAGQVHVRGTRYNWTEQIDIDIDTDPAILVNHNYFFPFVMEGDFFREIGPLNDRTQPRVFTTYTDLQFNFGITNRRLAGGRIDWVE